MNRLRSTFAAAGLAAAAVLASVATAPAHASDRTVVESFYSKLLTVGGSKDLNADVEAVLAPDWASIGDYSGKNKDRATFAKQVAGFQQLMPDLSWKIEEVIESGDRFVVRGRASGTPKGPLFGVEPSGKTFTIMTIDVHTVKGGKIATSYHVEDWAGALRQLKAN